MGPETRAVLAHAPALVCESLLLPCGLQFIPRLASDHILSRIKPREVLTDDFLGSIPFDGLGPIVPTDHVALWIKQVNGVVLYPGDHQAKPFLTLPQCFLGLFTLGDIGGNDETRFSAAVNDCVGGDLYVGQASFFPATPPASNAPCLLLRPPD